MFNDPENEICPESSQDLDDLAHDGLTAKMKEAKAASDAVKANDEEGLVAGQLFGEALTKVKPELKHGEYGKFCKDELHRSSSSCSLYVRLYKSRDDVQDALDWAVETGHPSAHCRAVREVLKVIGDYKKRGEQGDSAPAPAPKAPQKPSQVIAQLSRLLELANKEFIHIRDPLFSEDEARVMELVVALSAHDMTAIEGLVKLAGLYHWRLRDLVEIEMSTAVRLSLPAPAVSADAHQ